MYAFFGIFDVTINEYFVYRLSFVLWRFRNLLNLLLIYFLWSGIFAGKAQVFSYTQTQLISYILIVNVAGAIVLSTKTSDVAGEILSGDIMNYLLKPLRYGVYLAARETADKFLNSIFSMLEILLILVLFHPVLSIRTDPSTLVMAAFFLCLGIAISFQLSLLLSFIAFWTPEVWVPRFIYMIFVTFLSGNFFPLDILPGPLYAFFLLTPFPYLTYIPSKILVHGSDPRVYSLAAISIFWTIVLSYCLKRVWRKGMREFTFFGR